MAKLEKENIEVAFTTRFQQSLAEAKAVSSGVNAATMTFEVIGLNGSSTQMAVRYPDGIASREISHFRESILKQIVMRKISARSVRVTGLTYSITHTTQVK